MPNLRTITSAALVAGVFCLSAAVAHAGTWQVTSSSTDSYQVLLPATPSILTFGQSNKGMMILNLSATGTSAANQQQSNQASRSGATYTFTWVPSNSTDWPSAYTIKSIENVTYSCAVKGTTTATTAQVFQGTSTTPVIEIVYPGTNTAITQAPTFTTTTTSGTGYTTKTTVSNTRSSGAYNTSGWIRSYGTNTIVETNYTAGYFTANFTQPSAVQIVVTIPNKVIKASLSYSGASSSSAASVTAILSTIVAGQ